MRVPQPHFHAPHLPHVHGPSQAQIGAGVLVALFAAAILAALAAVAFDPARLGTLPAGYPVMVAPL